MKILIFTTLYPNKCMPQHGLFIKSRVKALAAQNHEVQVVAPVPWSPAWSKNPKWSLFRQVPAEEYIDGIKVYHPRYFITPKIARSLYGTLMYLSLLGFVKKLRRRFDFDLMDAHFLYPDGFAGVRIARALGKKVVLNGRGTDINWYPQFWAIRQCIQYAVENADAVTVVTETLMDELKKWGFKINNPAVIANGVDADTFCFRPQEEARRTLNLPADRPIILSIGHLLETKGFHLLIEAMRHIDRQVDLVIIGKGEYRKELLQLANQYKLNDRIKILEEIPQQELAIWYAAADIFALTSLREGRPNVVVEALACGTPVVSMNKWGLAQLVTLDKGILLDNYEPKGIAAAIKEGLHRYWDRRNISAGMQTHTWEKSSKQVAELMQKVVSQRDILFFSSDDWNSGLKTSKFHLSTRLARGYRVFFINSLGLRAPTFSKSDARKIAAKLKSYFKGIQSVRNNLHVYTPILIPFQRFALVRWLNKLFLYVQFRWLMIRYRIKNPDIWTFLPNTAELVSSLPHRKLIYYCVDDMSAFQGVAADVIRRQDQELTRKAHKVFAVSQELCRQKKEWNADTHYSPHGVDFELFNQACGNGAVKKPVDLENIAKPIIGFYGLISSDWIDYDLVNYLAQNRPQWSFVFIGKVDVKNGETLPQRENIHYLSVKPYEELHRYSRFFDVAILPFAINPLTLHSNPLKILEYLSSGNPVVSVKIPEILRYSDLIALADNKEDFLNKIESYLQKDNTKQRTAGINFAALNSWDKRFDEIQNIINNT